jgi:hypothetical protein
MSFSWRSRSAYANNIENYDANEIRTNVNTIYVDLALAPFSWVHIPPGIGAIVGNTDAQELRTAIDYAKDQNYCRTHYATYQAAFYTGVQSTNYGSQLYSHRHLHYNSAHGSD